MNERKLIEWEDSGEIELNLVEGAERRSRKGEPEAELLRVTEAAQLLALSRTKVYEMAVRGQIPVLRVGTAVRIPRRKLLEWIEAQTTGCDHFGGR